MIASRALVAALLSAARPLPASGGVVEAQRFLRQGDVERAVAELERAFSENPSDVEVATSLGQALTKLGRRVEAEVAYRRAIELAPGRPAAYAGLGDLLAEDPARWRRREEIAALLAQGLARLAANDRRRLTVTLSLANFERSVGRTADARRRLEEVDLAGLSPERRRRALDLLESIRSEERALGLRDWPEPDVPDGSKSALAEADHAFVRGEAKVARDVASTLVDLHPGWRAPLWLRARTHEALGRHDLAQRDLTVLLQLQPSHADGWRLLGRILALYGGALEAERADLALRRALAQEPGWWDLWLLRAQVAVRRGRFEEAERALDRYRRAAPARAEDAEVIRLAAAARAGSGGERRMAAEPAKPPTAQSVDLRREAQEWLDLGDPAGLATPLLERALAESPGFVEAAATLYAIGGKIPGPTIRALWGDGEALLDLSRRVRMLGHEEARALAGPWIDRAIDLGVAAARLERAVLRIDQGDRAAAKDDLLRYVASGPEPARIDEARVLMAALVGGRPPQGPAALARADLAEERADEALQALGARCDGETPGDRLLPLGAVHEWRADHGAAIACYREALRRDPAATVALARLAGVAARAPTPALGGLLPALRRAAGAGVPAAHLALARLEPADALAQLEHFQRVAAPDDPNLPAARSMRDRLATARQGIWRWGALVAVAIGLSVLALWRWLGGAKLSHALRRHPHLFPEVARTVAQLRHDVLKHRTSVLGMDAPTEEIARALWQPDRASAVVAAAYDALRSSARGRGVRLRRLSREPVFGPLVSDLGRAERLAREGGSPQALGRLGARLREFHSERLARLLRMGPRTRLDASQITRWIRDVEAELRARGRRWVSPVLHLEGLELDFPVERAALGAIFSNLLRNAQEAVEEFAAPSVLVRLAEERDETGRRLFLMLVGDSSPQALSLEAVEGREGGRGLAIVRDTVREWRGHLVIRSEIAPWQKGVGACFPG